MVFFVCYNPAMSQPVLITKSDGTRQPFDEEKLVNSLKHVGAAPAAIDEITDEVERGMKDGMTTYDIYNRAFALLKQHHSPTAVKYSIRRAMLELGPDGFPFEKFVARIFQAWGYETLTDQTLKGSCVEHEIDVVAWKGEALAMVEAKYHNEFGLKSDLKVALYVKARFDDLSGPSFSYGGKARKLSERWLVTNTKFTDKAITYAGCQGLKLVGWNYPEQGNLHDQIGQNGLHPLTCLSLLSHQEKRDLIGRNVLTCMDIVAKPAVLSEAGIKGDRAEKVIGEAQLIVEQAK